MMSSRQGGGLRIKKKGARGFMCGCGGSKAVSISDGSEKQSPGASPATVVMSSSTPTTTAMSFSTTTTTTTKTKGGSTRRAGKNKMATADAPPSSSFSPSSYYADHTSQSSSSVDSTPSLSALLSQLRDLERGVRFLHSAAASASGGAGTDVAAAAAAADKTNGAGRRHRRTVSDDGWRVEESVAVVKESADPLADFRRSMLQMIVEKEIVGGAELRELLHRFLSLNSPHHHHLILQAFAEIWEEVFAGYDRTPDFLASHRSYGNNNHKQQPQLQLQSVVRGAY